MIGIDEHETPGDNVYSFYGEGPVVSVWAEYRLRRTIGVHAFASTARYGGGCFEPFFCDEGQGTSGGGPGLTFTIPETTLYLASTLWVGRWEWIPGTFVGVQSTLGAEVELNPHATLGAGLQMSMLHGSGNVRAYGFVATVGFK